MEILYVTPFRPISTGHGGEHRAYQILHDCIAAVGGENVQVFCLGGTWEEGQTSLPRGESPTVFGGFSNSLATKLRRCARITRRNPLKPFGSWCVSPVSLWNPDALKIYRHYIDKSRSSKICLIENAGLGDFVRLNRSRGIPTIAVPANIESFDEGPYNFVAPMSLGCRLIDFGQELATLKLCEARLCISQVETAILNGLVGDSVFYPYSPVGEIRNRLFRIRRGRRACQEQNIGQRPFFIMLGTASHAPTCNGMRWILEQIETSRDSFPAELIVVGGGTERFRDEFRLPSYVTIKGWVAEQELDDLLVRATGAIAPHFEGFGALTRLAELKTAGVPVITTEHVAYALNGIDRALVVSRRWEEWLRAAALVVDGHGTAPIEEAFGDDEELRSSGRLSKEISRLLNG